MTEMNLIMKISHKCCMRWSKSFYLLQYFDPRLNGRPCRLYRTDTKVVERDKEIVYANKAVMHKRFQSLYLLDEAVATEFASYIVADFSYHASPVMEMNSGPGFITKKLLKAGISSIYMYEKNTWFHPRLLRLVEKHPNILSLKEMDYYDIVSLAKLDWFLSTNLLNSHLNYLKKSDWLDIPVCTIILAMYSLHFIDHLIMNTCSLNFLTNFGRYVFYIAMPTSLSKHLNHTNEKLGAYRDRSILFQVLFDIKILGTLPMSAFHPKYGKYPNYAKFFIHSVGISYEDMTVVRIETKRNLFNTEFTPDDLFYFYYFVKQNLKARKLRVIPALEQWIPGCGQQYIMKKDFTIYTTFGDLTPNEILKVFIDFKSFPHYKNSAFMSAVAPAKMNEPDEDDFDELDNLKLTNELDDLNDQKR